MLYEEASLRVLSEDRVVGDDAPRAPVPEGIDSLEEGVERATVGDVGDQGLGTGSLSDAGVVVAAEALEIELRFALSQPG